MPWYNMHMFSIQDVQSLSLFAPLPPSVMMNNLENVLCQNHARVQTLNWAVLWYVFSPSHSPANHIPVLHVCRKWQRECPHILRIWLIHCWHTVRQGYYNRQWYFKHTVTCWTWWKHLSSMIFSGECCWIGTTRWVIWFKCVETGVLHVYVWALCVQPRARPDRIRECVCLWLVCQLFTTLYYCSFLDMAQYGPYISLITRIFRVRSWLHVSVKCVLEYRSGVQQIQ